MPPVSTADLLRSFDQGQANQPSVASGVAKGFEFASQRANLELKQQQLEQRKKEAEVTKADQAIRSGSFVLDQLNRLKDTPNKSARKIIAGQIARVAGSGGFEMDEVNLKELESDEENVSALTNKMNKLLELAPPNMQDVMRASLSETIATQPLSVTAKKLDQFEKDLLAEPARQKAQEITERETRVKEASVGIANQKFKFEQDKFAKESQLKLQGLEIKKEAAKSAKEKIIVDRTIKERKEIESKPEVINYVDVRTAVRSAVDAIQGRTPLQDAASIFAIVKVLDPGSVVRSSEGELVTKAGSLGEKIFQMLDEVSTGKKFPEARRKEAMEIFKSNLLNRMEAVAVTVAGRAPTNKKFGMDRSDWDPTVGRFRKDMELLKGTFKWDPKKEGKKTPNILKNSKTLDPSGGEAKAIKEETLPPKKPKKLSPRHQAIFNRLSAKLADGTATEKERVAFHKLQEIQGRVE